VVGGEIGSINAGERADDLFGRKAPRADYHV